MRQSGFIKEATQSTISCKGQWTKKAMDEGAPEGTVRAYADVIRTCKDSRVTPPGTEFEDWGWPSEEMGKAFNIVCLD